MKVCIDIQSAIAQRAGIGRYTHQLVRHMAEHAGADELTLFCFDFKGRGCDADMPQTRLKCIRWCPGRAAQFAWKALRWPPFDLFAGSSDLYHFPNFFLPPLRHGKSVVTIHDVSFLRYPHFAEKNNLRFLRRHIQKTCARADAVITDSQFSADEISDLLHVDPSRVFPIHLGISPGFQAPSETAQTATRVRLKLERPYLLTVGTVEPRKNISFLLDLFEQFSGFDGDLVIAGMPGWKCEPILDRIRHSTCHDRIRYLDYVDDADLPSLYAGAQAFVLASVYEGFGFPPLEAMACGTPVLSSDGGSLAEVLGDAATVLAGFNLEQWDAALRDIVTSTDQQNRMIERGLHHAARYTWSETARRTWEVYRRVNT